MFSLMCVHACVLLNRLISILSRAAHPEQQPKVTESQTEITQSIQLARLRTPINEVCVTIIILAPHRHQQSNQASKLDQQTICSAR